MVMADDGYTGWSGRVAWADGYAYVPRQVVVRGTAARDYLTDHHVEERESDGEGGFLMLLPENVDVPASVADLRDLGFNAEPNYVLFAHDVGANPFLANPFLANTAEANPFLANPFLANPFLANPFLANPFLANPFLANPFLANPFLANPGGGSHLQQSVRRTGFRLSSARPAQPPGTAIARRPIPKNANANPSPPAVFVLDTGLAADSASGPKAQRPSLLRRLPNPDGDRELPDEDADPDGLLDPVAGHGTFIGGLIEQLSPNRQLQVLRVLTTLGDGDEWKIAQRIRLLLANGFGGVKIDDRTVVNLSFGSYAPEDMRYLGWWIRRLQDRGAVVVASAGNDATCAPSYPACFPGVVSVGALGPWGPAPFTNYGPWVRACAPGVDLVSSFFKKFDGPFPGQGRTDVDEFRGWAVWSGTSFAAPVVAAVLAREIATTDCTAAEAVAAVIDAPGLARIPGLGTVINPIWSGWPAPDKDRRPAGFAPPDSNAQRRKK